MSDPTWAEIDNLSLQILDACTDGQPRAIGRINVRHRYEVIRVAIEQLVHSGLLAASYGAVHTTYTITEQGRRHLAAAKVG